MESTHDRSDTRSGANGRRPASPHFTTGAVRGRRPRPGRAGVGRRARRRRADVVAGAPAEPAGRGRLAVLRVLRVRGQPAARQPGRPRDRGVVDRRRVGRRAPSRGPRRLRPRDRDEGDASGAGVGAVPRRRGTGARRGTGRVRRGERLAGRLRAVHGDQGVAAAGRVDGVAARTGGAPVRRAGAREARTRGRDRPTAVRAVPVRPTARGSSAVRGGAGCQTDGRHAHLHLGRFVRRVGEAAALPSRPAPAPEGRRGCAAGLLRRDRAAVGQPALQLVRDAARRLRVVGGARAGHARAGGRGAPGSLPRV